MAYHHPRQTQPQVAVVVVPFPAQGHLNQLLQLSRLISFYHIPVHYVGSATHNRQAKLRNHGWDPLSATNIHFHEFSTPHFLSPPPDPHAAVKFPSHLQPSFEASSHLRRPVAALMRELSQKFRRIIIVNDSLMGSVVQDFVSLQNADAYTFHSVSAFAMALFFRESTGKHFSVHAELLNGVPSLDGCFTADFLNFLKTQHYYTQFSSGRIYNACRLIEAPFLDILSQDHDTAINKNKKHWALGPFNPISITHNKRPNSRHKCLEWLDKHDQNSVILVSFGTTISLSEEQIKELATGLEQSGQKFIWVLRDADKGDVFNEEDEVRRAELPKGFEDRVEGRGLVVREWAPQLEILGHPSTGAFMSHCGWNSCMESITMGVPMAAWPVHSDQPRNAVLVTKFLKIGLPVKDWARRDEVVIALTVKNAVKKLMAAEEGREMRKRAEELGGAVRRSAAEGGASCKEMDAFIAHITRI